MTSRNLLPFLLLILATCITLSVCSSSTSLDVLKKLKEQKQKWSNRYKLDADDSINKFVDRLGTLTAYLGSCIGALATKNMTKYLDPAPSLLENAFNKQITKSSAYEIVDILYNLTLKHYLQGLYTIQSFDQKILLLKLFAETLLSSAYTLKVKFNETCPLQYEAKLKTVWTTFGRSLKDIVYLLGRYLLVTVEADQTPLDDVVLPIQSVINLLENQKPSVKPRSDLINSTTVFCETMKECIQNTSESSFVGKNMTSASDSLLTFIVDSLPGFGINLVIKNFIIDRSKSNLYI